MLKEITELGLKHVEDKKVSTTLLGHEIVLQDVVANVAGAVKWAENYSNNAVKDLPYASIVMAGVSLVPSTPEEPDRRRSCKPGWVDIRHLRDAILHRDGVAVVT
jgi:hypothetical protein